MTQTILDQLFNSRVGSIKRCLIYDHDSLRGKTDVFAGLCCILQELRVNDDSGSLGQPELMGKLIDGVCRVRVPSNTVK